MIHVQSFTFNPFQENTYLVWNDRKECFIIDPGCHDRREEQELTGFIETNDLKPVALLNTHCHIDHVLGNDFVARKYGLTPQIHKLEIPVLNAVGASAQMFGVPYTPSPEPTMLSENSVMLGDEKFEILFVPGHSPGHVAFYHSDSKTLISGDVLFRQSIGRTDLPGGDMQTLLDSIRNVLFSLPDDTKVYAGHMEPTNIGYEKANNPFMR